MVTENRSLIARDARQDGGGVGKEEREAVITKGPKDTYGRNGYVRNLYFGEGFTRVICIS